MAGNPWNGDRASVGNGSGRRLGCERAHGHARAMGGDDGSRAEIVGLPLEGSVHRASVAVTVAKPRRNVVCTSLEQIAGAAGHALQACDKRWQRWSSTEAKM